MSRTCPLPRRILPLVVLLVLAASTPCTAQLWPDNRFTVEEAPVWTALFDRDTGWSGADGIFSIPLDGDDRPGTADGGNTLFVFSDTFIGDVSPAGERLDPTVMINNTAALLRGGAPDQAAIEFLYRTDGSGQPASLIVPDTPLAEPDHWYWLGDGVAIDGTLYVFACRMRRPEGGGFATDGVALISLPILAQPGEPRQVDTPLFLPADEERGDVIFGAGILDNTAAAGAPFPDGYIYVFGTQNDPYIKKLVAARVRPAAFADFSSWEFYGPDGWSGDITRLAEMAPRVSNELSVSPLPDGSGRFVLVFQEDAIGRYVSLRVGASPIGPWSRIRRIYECPEPAFDGDIYTYNAKAHPHLSRPGELLVSYNVNTLDFWDHFRYADIYRPRFIRIRLSEAAAERPGTAPSLTLTAGPNPCNPRTEIRFSLPAAAMVRLEVFDLAGRSLATLCDGVLAAGAHTVAWNGRDDAGNPAPAGVYLCRLQADGIHASVRISLVK